MNKEQIDEIAMRVWNESESECDVRTGRMIITEFTRALLDELAKVQEPVSQVTCQIYGHVVGACDACNTHAENDVNETNKILADNYLKLTCGSSPSVLEGWQLVPIEPTESMIAAMQSSGWMLGNYKAMLSAAARSE